MTYIIDIYALQTVPPSLINRDDMGAPKTAIFGGVPRQRVSSQSWKRAVRKYFETEIEGTDIGLRSRELPEVIAKRVQDIAPEMSTEDALNGVRALFKATSKDGIKLVEPKKPKKGEELQRKLNTRLPVT